MYAIVRMRSVHCILPIKWCLIDLNIFFKKNYYGFSTLSEKKNKATIIIARNFILKGNTYWTKCAERTMQRIGIYHAWN